MSRLLTTGILQQQSNLKTAGLLFTTDQTSPETVDFTFSFATSQTMKVDYGDGTAQELTDTILNFSHTYTTAGTYEIKIVSTSYEFKQFLIQNNKLTDIQEFETINITTVLSDKVPAFNLSSNLFINLDLQNFIIKCNNDSKDYVYINSCPNLETVSFSTVSGQYISDLRITNNLNLTTINYNGIGEVKRWNKVYDNNLTGTLDLTGTIIDQIWAYDNPNLTGIDFNPTRQTTSASDAFKLYNTGLTGTLDLSMFFITTIYFRVYGLPGLTKINFRAEAGQTLGGQTVANSNNLDELNNIENVRFESTTRFDSNNLGFEPLQPDSGIQINLRSNGMTAAEVNEQLVHFDTLSYQPIDCTLNISGTNAPPDNTSGGFDGLSAITSLESKGWTITTS